MTARATVLVVGGAGYIGSHAVRELSHGGYETVALDNLSLGHRNAVQTGAFEEGDITDREFLRGVFSRHHIDVVMHFAAFAFVGESVTNPAKYYANNVGGTLTLLDAMREAGCGRIIFSSTCATYGMAQHLPIREDHPQQPINPYGRGKLMVEQILADYGHAYGLKSIVFRYFNAAGAHPDGDLGEQHEPETHLIPLVLNAITGGQPIKVFGDDYPTADGTCVRDYIHVVDLSRAHVLGMERLLAAGESATFNLGNGSGYSVSQVIDAAERVTSRKVPREIAPRRVGDPAVLVGSAEAAIRELGWRPQFAALDRIIETAWNWHQHVTSTV